MDEILPNFDDCLAKLAELSVSVGVNLQRGQGLIINAPLEARDLVRCLTASAYRAGASEVTCLYEDPQSYITRLRHADDASYDCCESWVSDAIKRALEAGAAYLNILGPYPNLLNDVPVERIARLHTAMHNATSGLSSFLAECNVNASAIPFATENWAQLIYPGKSPGSAKHRLWRAIFTATRANMADPINTLTEHLRTLDLRRTTLQYHNFSHLHFNDCDSDFSIGLVEGHCWSGGTVTSKNGVVHTLSLIAEELFAAAHRETANGTVVLSRPLALPGGLVDGARLEFRDGRIVSLSATHGQKYLENLLTIDEDAGRIGEVGITPVSNPLSSFATGFLNPMLDRNSCCNIAFGHPVSYCLTGTIEIDGINKSSIHLDCSFGGQDINVDGIHPSGQHEPIMRNGQFVI